MVDEIGNPVITELIQCREQWSSRNEKHGILNMQAKHGMRKFFRVYRKHKGSISK